VKECINVTKKINGKRRGKKLVLKFFSPARIALIKEVKHHPELVGLLANYKSDDWPGMIGEIAAYCLVFMDGMYMPAELDRLCDILHFKLQAKRIIIVH